MVHDPCGTVVTHIFSTILIICTLGKVKFTVLRLVKFYWKMKDDIAFTSAYTGATRSPATKHIP